MNYMKKIYTILLLGSCLIAASCSDWLNVAPSNQVNEDQLFSNGEGYRSALNGVYLSLGTSSMYGSVLSWGFMDAIAQYYKTDSKYLPTHSSYYKAVKYQFDDKDVKSIISNIWTTSYNNIANCNNLIAHVSVASPSVFAEREFEQNMIWGEALGLRAMIHFEILRMFAPAMMKDDGKAYIPYNESHPTIIPSYLSNSDILAKVIRDLKEAKEKLAKCDIIDEYKDWMSVNQRMLSQGRSDKLSEEIFFGYRGYRMNYYAITAMLARVYCWKGDYDLAYNEAKEVVDVIYTNGNSVENCFNFALPKTLGANLKDYNSIIMCFFNKTLQEDYQPLITNGNQTTLVLEKNKIFPDAQEPGKNEDQRLELQVTTVEANPYLRKYDIQKGTDGTDMIPAIRLSEMYYIMGEYFARNSNFSEAGKMLDKVRYARGIITTNLGSSVGSLEGFHTELLKEARKEFMGEGQMFFQYKRLDKKPDDLANAIFVFDKPDSEDI